MQAFAISKKSINLSDAGMHKNKPQPFFSPIKIQPKLKIGAVNDSYEQEANAMADRVMKMPEKNDSAQSFFKPAISSIQKKCSHCEEEKLQMKGENDTSAATIASPLVHDVISSGGHSMDDGTRNFMEQRFGYDFKNVQIHNDSKAHQSSAEINALAYTHGNHVVFGASQYQPNTNNGKQLLAHELTHVLQQNNNNLNTSLVQKQTVNTNKDPASGIENDPQSFSIEAAKHYFLFERNKVEQHLYSANCSIQALLTVCDLVTNDGIKLKVRWATDTNRVIVKSCIDNSCVACGYDYTADATGNLVLSKIKCWPVTDIE